MTGMRLTDEQVASLIVVHEIGEDDPTPLTLRDTHRGDLVRSEMVEALATEVEQARTVDWADWLPDGVWEHPSHDQPHGVTAKACVRLSDNRWVRVVVTKMRAADGAFRPSVRVDVVDGAHAVVHAGLACADDGSGAGLVAVAVRELLASMLGAAQR